MSKNAVSIINEAESFLLLAHRSPDIDSIASAIAIKLTLEQKGKDVKVSCLGTTKELIEHFAHQLNVEITEPNYDVDCIIVVDTNSPALFDFEGVKKSKAKKILIDHHSPKTEVMNYFDECIIDETAVSTTQIVYFLLKELNQPMTRELAIAISAGIVTDSANFIAATPEAFHVLADSLTEAKVSFQDVLKTLAIPLDLSEKIARLKGAQRLEVFREGDYLIITSKVSSFGGSVARSLLKLGADVVFVAASKDDEARISARARTDLVEKGFHLGRDILPSIANVIEGDAGGHAAAAGANGVNTTALDNALVICVSKTREFLKSL